VNRGRTAILAFVISASAAATAQEAEATRYALLIGLNHSKANRDGVAELRYAVNDAKALEKMLSDQGWTVFSLTEAAAMRGGLVGELSRLARNARPQDTVLIYFAGHGVRAKMGQFGGRSHSYWITFDSTLTLLDEDAIRLEHVMDYIEDIPARQKLVILDHCHSGTVELPRSGPGGSRDVTGGGSTLRSDVFPRDDLKVRVDRVQDTLLVLGSAKDAAYEPKNLEHGLFTTAVLEAFGTNAADKKPDGNEDGKLSAAELVNYLQKRVQKLADDSHVKQDWIYLPRGDVLSWNIMPVGNFKDAEEALGDVLGRLEARGLDAQTENAVRLAITQWANARRSGTTPPDSVLKIVNRLQNLFLRAQDVDWRMEARSLPGFVQEVNRP